MDNFVDDQSEGNPNLNIKSIQSHFCVADTDLLQNYIGESL